METNYELKHKCLLVPLKAVLLVLAMVLIGFTTFAQQGKVVRVANDLQLTEALQNPSIRVVELEPGYYAQIGYLAEQPKTLTKAVRNDGSRDLECTYFIIDATVCIPTAIAVENPPVESPAPPLPPGFYYSGNAVVGTSGGLGVCPGPNVGSWQWITSASTYAPGDALYFGEGLDRENMDFWVTGPGIYALRYSWGAPYNTFVQTEYVFLGPNSIDLTADDVCGTSTTAYFTLEGLTSVFDFTIDWYAKKLSTETIYDVTGIQETGSFTFDVSSLGGCGIYELTALVYTTFEDYTTLDCADTISIIIEFSCDPVAEAAGDDVCALSCADLIASATVLGEVSPSFAYSWVNLSGPQDQLLTFDPQSGNVPGDASTEACRAEVDLPDVCPYGEYEVQLQVQNGLCYDEDNAIVRFYEQPEAYAGTDQHLCNTFAFNLAAVPYVYCGEEGVNYWPESHWEIVGVYPDDVTIEISDVNDPAAMVTITYTADCPYGLYEFKWVENNSKGMDLGGCSDDDNVIVTIYENPAPSAGPDLVFCDTFAFSLWGIGDEPCYEPTTVVYSWEKTAEPGNCNVTFDVRSEPGPDVLISGCDPDECAYGKYTFEFTQSNGYTDENGYHEVCATTDDVDVWILEPAAADAGPDQHLCYSFEFNMAAVPTDFCGEAGVNYFTWGQWEFVSGPDADVEIDNIYSPLTKITIDPESTDCPYGVYVFKWTEYNGFGLPFEGCSDEDLVYIYIDEVPESVDAGDDMIFCEEFEFDLDGTIDEPCIETTLYSYNWQLIAQPDNCMVTFDPYSPDPAVTITNCEGCGYGEYVFRLTQKNGYYNDEEEFVTVCDYSDEVSVWIYEEPEVNAGPDQNLCADYTFDLNGTSVPLCGDFGVNYNNWYSWTLVSQPEGAGCEVTITNGTTLTPSVEIANCAGPCAYGEFVFRLTEYNGTEEVYCSAYDEVKVTIFEDPEADAGDDYKACVSADAEAYCFDMTGSLEYCYSMSGKWTKTCGPGNVTFEDLTNPSSPYCVDEPGRYKFTWTAWNDAEGCIDEEEVIIDLVEQPSADGELDKLTAPCDQLCVDLGQAGIDKYVYIGTEWTGDPEDCPNYWDNAYWSFVSGPGAVTFADDTDPATELCVSVFGCYTVRWNEVNKSIDGEQECSSYFDVFIQFTETPEPDAGEDAILCGNCYTLDAEPYIPLNCAPTDVVSYWEFVSYEPPVDACPTDDFAPEYSPAYSISDVADPKAEICIVDDCFGTHYGTYGFKWVNGSGECVGEDIVYIEFLKVPEELTLTGQFDPSNCNDSDCPECVVRCLVSDEKVLEVCAGSCLDFDIDWLCESNCFGGPIPGFTYEWSFIGPAGSYMVAEPYWYDCDDECWRGSDGVHICFGECCDTARLYLTITSPQGCTTTQEWKFYVNHKPCAEITDMNANPGFAEVGMVSEYCNVCPPDYDMNCALYTWTAEHCGVIQSGQGTECINVLWTNYNVNGGWGRITLTVFDTCTGCCNYDEMMIKVYPTGTLGTATLSGTVFYDNNFDTPLNGVEITLWNGGVPVMTTTSFNQIEPPTNGPGYYEFTGINATTNFTVTANYDAPWYGANATDALAVELYWANDAIPAGILSGLTGPSSLIEEAMDVNNLSGINGTDALWIKQRAINMVGYFPAGNWAYVPNMVTTAGNFDIPVLNMGDANRSNIPSSMKSMPAIDLVNDGMMNVVNGQVFDLPIRIEKANQFGAMTLELEYNSALIEVEDVYAVEGMLSNINNGTVSIAWSNVNPMVLADNDVVVTLKAKAIGEIAATETLFNIGINSEFADATANVVEPVTLKSFGVTTDPASLDYFLSANRPNPFNTSTFIEYTMPETGKVKLSVLDMLGQELNVLVNATQTAGTYTVEFNATGLATGVYIYKITVDGETRDFISTQRMVVSH